MTTLCAVDGCNKPSRKYRLCSTHASRFLRHGDPNIQGGKRSARGAPIAFFNRLLAEDFGEDCVFWPYAQGGDKWAEIKIEGTLVPERVGTLLCQRTHGPKPSDRHMALSSCGNGTSGCVNRRHFFWGTALDVDAIKVLHGKDNRCERNGRAVLNNEQALLIRQLAMTGRYVDRELAEQFGVSRKTVSRIRRGTHWKHLEEHAENS